MAEAGQEKEMPSTFSIFTKKHEMPIGSAIILSTTCAVMLVIYGLMAENAEELYWTLFSFGAIIFLMLYIAMHCFFLKLHQRDSDKFRPFRVPGSELSAKLISGLLVTLLFGEMLARQNK
jgi:amino acid transporter